VAYDAMHYTYYTHTICYAYHTHIMWIAHHTHIIPALYPQNMGNTHSACRYNMPHIIHMMWVTSWWGKYNK